MNFGEIQTFPNITLTYYLGCTIPGEITVAVIVWEGLMGKAENGLPFNGQDF